MAQSVTLNTLAARCAVSSMLLVRYFPAAWAVPRDWCMNGPNVMISAWSLSALALELDAAGLMEVGNGVRAVRDELLPVRSWAREVES